MTNEEYEQIATIGAISIIIIMVGAIAVALFKLLF